MNQDRSRRELANIPDDDGGGELSTWATVVGPCYSAASLSRVIGLPEADVLRAATDYRVLSLRTADYIDVFPCFQVRDGCLYPNLQPVLEALRAGVDDPWTWAQWLNSPGFDGVTAMEQLWAGVLDVVLQDARHDAWAWRA